MGEAQAPLAENGADDKDDGPGYTTTDDAGSDDDDTVHEAVQSYEMPDCVSYRRGAGQERHKTIDKLYDVVNGK